MVANGSAVPIHPFHPPARHLGILLLATRRGFQSGLHDATQAPLKSSTHSFYHLLLGLTFILYRGLC